MKLFVLIILSLIFSHGLEAQSKLPKEMPGIVSISLYRGGGMTRAHKKIKIESGILEYSELVRNGTSPEISWSVEVTVGDLAKLYKVFVDNKFDTIKNDKRKAIANDAGSENISISVNHAKTFWIASGLNSPLSGRNLDRYHAVSQAIYALAAQYKASLPPKNYTMGEAEKYIQGKWRAAGENGGHTWFLEWAFDKGNFKMLGYPALFQEGKYRVVTETDDKLTIELYGQKGTFGEKDRKVEIVMDKQSGKLAISRMDGFSRTGD